MPETNNNLGNENESTEINNIPANDSATPEVVSEQAVEQAPVETNQEVQNEAPVTPEVATPEVNQTIENEGTTVPESPVENETVIVSTEPKTKKSILPIILVVVVALIVGIAVFLYISLQNNPTKAFKNVINDAYQKVNDSLDMLEGNNSRNYDFREKSVYVTGDLNISGSLMDLNDLKDDTFGFELGMDYKNKEMKMSGSLSENKKEILDMTIMARDKTLYMKSNTMYTNVYKEDQEESLFDSIDIKDLESSIDEMTKDLTKVDKTLEALKDALIKSLDEKNMVISKETLNINGKNVKVNKVSYALNKESTKKLFSSFADAVLSNDELLNNLSSYMDISKNELIDGLKEFKKDEMYENFEEEDNAEIVIYTTGLAYTFVRAEFNQKDNNLVYVNYKDDFELSAKSTYSSFSIIGELKNNKNVYTVTSNKEKMAEVVVNENSDKKLDVDYKLFSDEKEVLSGNITLNVEKDTKEEYKANIIVSLVIDNDGTKEDIKIAMNLDIKFGEKVITEDLTKAISKDNISSADNEKAEQAMKNLEETKVYKYIDGISSMLTPNYNYKIDDTDYNITYDDEDVFNDYDDALEEDEI